MLKPNSFQISVTIMVPWKKRLSPKKKAGWPPKAIISLLTIPVDGERISISTPESIIHDRKCGRYTIVCTVLFSLEFLISFISMEKRMAIRIPKASFPREIISVLRSALIKSGYLEIY